MRCASIMYVLELSVHAPISWQLTFHPRLAPHFDCLALSAPKDEREWEGGLMHGEPGLLI